MVFNGIRHTSLILRERFKRQTGKKKTCAVDEEEGVRTANYIQQAFLKAGLQVKQLPFSGGFQDF